MFRLHTISKRRRAGWFVAVVVLGAMLPAGCGSSDPFDYARVSGKVTYDDGSLIPAARITVTFLSQAPAVDAKTHPRPGMAEVNTADGTFDIVYAPYVISVVPDPIAVAREMWRVCRPGGRIVFLSHFRSPNPLLAWIERVLSPFTVHIGFKSDLDLPAFLAQTELKPISIERVNIPRIWSLVTCIKD